MLFDPGNHIVKLCAHGMMLEGEGKMADAEQLFQQAWTRATTATEKFVAAHYLARHQTSIANKLKWDETALDQALLIGGTEVESIFPSLYLNIGKCHEDMNDLYKAYINYQTASTYLHALPDDGYGNMIRSGIINGLNRVAPNESI